MKSCLDRADYESIKALLEKCLHKDEISLKLELDYKLEDALNNSQKTSLHDINEFMYFDCGILIGYIGICRFGSDSTPIEITGMVHPEYRCQGVFSKLFELCITECKKKYVKSVLFLCDRKSLSGQKFLTNIKALYKYSEYEMYLSKTANKVKDEHLNIISLRKAKNEDADEIARQNVIYFGGITEQDNDLQIKRTILPEEEEKRGMVIYIAQKDKQIIGKVHLQLINGIGGIYGLGVLPQYRGKGFGRAILLHAIQKLKSAKADDIFLQVEADNEKAINLYGSCGFEQSSIMDYYELEIL